MCENSDGLRFSAHCVKYIRFTYNFFSLTIWPTRSNFTIDPRTGQRTWPLFKSGHADIKQRGGGARMRKNPVLVTAVIKIKGTEV